MCAPISNQKPPGACALVLPANTVAVQPLPTALPTLAGPRAAWVHPLDRGDEHAQVEARPARPNPGRPSFEPQRAPGERYVEREVERDEDVADDGAFGSGSRVWHDKFQAGVVISVDAGADPIVTVRFPGYGDKRIKASFLRSR